MMQIQAIKFQIENMKLQLDNIQMQSNNMFIMNNPGEQLLNLSIQMINAGIQAFNTGKNMAMILDIEKFYVQLRNLSEQIKLIINEKNTQHIMMPQQMSLEQQLMMIKQEQMAMQKERMAMQKQYMNIQQNPIGEGNNYLNVIFQRKHYPDVPIVVKFGTTVEELLNLYMKREVDVTEKKFFFIWNSKKINKNEKESVEKYFCNLKNVTILIIYPSCTMIGA